MIVYFILDCILNAYQSIFGFLSLPGLPPELISVLNSGIDYMVAGSTLLFNYFDPFIFISCFTLIFLLEGGFFISMLVIRILKLIPIPSE